VFSGSVGCPPLHTMLKVAKQACQPRKLHFSRVMGHSGGRSYFFIKNKDWDAFWPLLKYTVFTCRFKWQKTHINNNKNSRTRGGKSGGVEDQPQPRRLWRSRTPNARSLSRPSSFPPSSHNLSFPRVHWCVMGRLVHRSPVSSYLIAQVLHPF